MFPLHCGRHARQAIALSCPAIEKRDIVGASHVLVDAIEVITRAFRVDKRDCQCSRQLCFRSPSCFGRSGPDP
jgi:hypothetical protein